jgi:hypothetical protein
MPRDDRSIMTELSHSGPVRTAVLVALAALLIPSAAPAEPAALLSVTATTEQQPYRFTGGGIVRVPLRVHGAPAGVELRARLVQVTERLAVPVGDEIPLTTPGAGSDGLAEIELPLPVVERETRFELRVHARGVGDADPWRRAGRVSLVVYPADLLAPLRAWSEKNPLRLKDDGALATVLKDHGVRIAAPSAVRPKGGISLRTGEFARRFSGLPTPGETIVLFTERDAELSHVVIEPSGPGTIVRVEGRLLSDVATNPESQKTLLEIIELALDRTPMIR